MGNKFYFRNMMAVIVTCVILFPISVKAQMTDIGEDPDEPPPAIPIDGGSSVLISLGIVYVLRKSRSTATNCVSDKRNSASESGDRKL